MIDWEKIKTNIYKFLNYTYTYSDIQNFQIIKIYTESSHFDRVLVKDTVNNLLYLYEFYEQFLVDTIFTTWVLVTNEADADLLNKEQNIIRTNSFRFDDNMQFSTY